MTHIPGQDCPCNPYVLRHAGESLKMDTSCVIVWTELAGMGLLIHTEASDPPRDVRIQFPPEDFGEPEPLT